MADPVPVSVGWALWGKQQGTRNDYSILASSAEPLSELEFTSVLTHFVAGTPPTTERGRPESLPWVTISRVGKADQRYLGISIQDLAGTVDAAGRPSTSTSYFCVPYAELAGHPVSYPGLYQQLREIQLPYQGNSLIRLSVPRLDPLTVADAIEEFGETVVAAAAALLLSGPVSIVGAEGTELLDRLRFLDAVAALLPYGYRAGGYTAATWSDSGTRHPIRLAFAARPRDGAGVIRWRTGPATAGGIGEAFLAVFRQVREQLPPAEGQARLQQLRALIGTMALDAAPCGFDQPERAVEAVRTFGLPFIVYNAARAGTADPADVRRVFTQNRLVELNPGQRRELLAELIRTAYREPENWNVIDDWWDPVVQGDSSAMLQPIFLVVQRRLRESAPSITISDYLTRAARGGIIDPLLAELVAVPGASPPEDRMTCAQSVAEQVADCVSSPPGTAGFPRTQRALADNPLVASLLLAHLADAGGGLQAVMAWLQPFLGELLAPFFTILGPAQSMIDWRAIDQLAGRGAGHVTALLNAASAQGRLQLVAPGFAGWLGHRMLGSVPLDQTEARYWRDRVVSLMPAGPDSQAWLDLALLISGEPPRFLLERRDQRSWRIYIEIADRGWAWLADGLGQAGDNALTGTLADFLRSGTWTADAGQAAAITDLAGRLTAGGRRTQLKTVISDVLAHTPEAREWPFARDWLPPRRESRRSAGREAQGSSAESDWQRSSPERRSTAPDPPAPPSSATASSREPSRQDPDREESSFSSSRLRPDATPAEVARFCAAEYRDMRRLADVLEELRRSKVIHSGAQAVAVFQELQRILPPLAGQRREVGDWLARFTERFADGSFGTQTAAEFRDLMIQSLLDAINDEAGVLRTLAAHDDRRLLGSHDNAESLNQAIKSLEEIRREARRRPARLPNLHLPGRQGSDGGGGSA